MDPGITLYTKTGCPYCAAKRKQFTDKGISFVEINVTGRSHPPQNGGRYQGRVEGPDVWSDDAHAPDRQTVFANARSILAA